MNRLHNDILDREIKIDLLYIIIGEEVGVIRMWPTQVQAEWVHQNQTGAEEREGRKGGKGERSNVWTSK